MADLIGRLSQQATMRAIARPAGTQTAERVMTEVADKKIAPTIQAEVDPRLQTLLDTNALVTAPTDAGTLIAWAKDGKITPDGATSLALGNVPQQMQQWGGKMALVLSDEGKKALARTPGVESIDPAIQKLKEVSFANSGLRFGSETHLPGAVDFNRGVDHVLIDARDHASLLQAYGEAVQRGEAPAAIGGKPFTDFFRPSDDFYNALELTSFQKAVPGFAQRPLDEQQAVTALAGRVAAEFPPDVSPTLRRRLAASMVTYQRVDQAAGSGLNPVGELKQFYKGVPASDKTPSIADSIVQEGFHVGSPGRYGQGVYHTPSPTTGAGYTYKNTVTPAEMLSGEVSLGNTVEGALTPASFANDAGADTRWIPRNKLDQPDNGDYAVTKDPTRFTIKAITRYQPAQTNGLDSMLPDLITAYGQTPTWATRYLDKIDPARAQRAYEYALANGTPDQRTAAGMLLARTGQPSGIKSALDTLLNSPKDSERRTAGSALVEATKAMGPERAQEAAPIIKALATSKYIDGQSGSVAKTLSDNLGPSARKLLTDAGWPRGPWDTW